MKEKERTKAWCQPKKKFVSWNQISHSLTVYLIDMQKRMDGPETMMAHDGQDHAVTRATCAPFMSHSNLQDRLGSHWITLFFYLVATLVATFSKFPLSAFSAVFS